MSYFRDTDHLYKVLGALFIRLRDEETIIEKAPGRRFDRSILWLQVTCIELNEVGILQAAKV